jgi:hypothetical protein
MNDAIKYANERKQFGVNIGRFGAIKHKIGEMATKHYASESASYRYGQLIEENIARLEAEGFSPQEAKLKGVEEYAIECALLKVYGSESNSEIIDDSVQIFGGMGYSAESSVESAYRDCRITRIYEGTNEINRMLSIGMLLKKALKGEMDLMTPAMAVAGDLMSIPSFDTPDYSSHLAQELEMVGKMKKAVLMVAGKAVETLGMEVEKHQEILMQISDMLCAVMTAESAVLRTQKLGKDETLKTKMTQLHVHNAVEHLGKGGREAIYAFAEGDDQRLLLMGLKRFTKYAEPVNPMRLRRDIAVQVLTDGSYKH